ncbi:MAG: Gfo/Idh/MocA family oxidoreductase [Armatimonadetes bacterium]|nr:Gfo/Idh/MocA family oxidoreductase [Armatimonadota bacterium]MDW8121781.1 Gfo/Idh/MocA family oxidoreductase [Armatimonadota bacterium]
MRTGRRKFLRAAGLGGGLFLFLRNSRSAWSYQANEKLNIGVIGAGGRGADLAREASDLGENVIALCDVDDERAADTYRRFPNAKKFRDFRKMLGEMGKDLDAVIVATADHTHAVASVPAMKMGLHCYCEKPLTYDIYEARMMRIAALENRVATQMGNGGTAISEFRQGVEILRSGVLGTVKEVHVWSNRPIWPQGIDRPKETPPVPPHLDWDLWLGPAPYRPYHPAYVPFAWRGWVDFGTGALGDMGCHTMNLPVMGLKLHRVVAEGKTVHVSAETSGFNGETYPVWSIIRYQFPARGNWAPVTLTWYDGGKKPPADLLMGEPMADSGCLVIGEKGTLYSPGDVGAPWVLLPRQKFAGFKPPEPFLPRSPGHMKEWLIACRGGPPALSNFPDYASYLTEIVLLGNVAIRLGKPVTWLSAQMKVEGCPEADPLIKRPYRKGWSL